jgi:hypothetical protein
MRHGNNRRHDAALQRLFLDIVIPSASIGVMNRKLLNRGILVEVEAFGGERLTRRIVEIRDETVYICREDEWNKAIEERREPATVGFNKRFITKTLGHGL